MLIATKNTMFREGIGSILRQDPSLRIVGEASTLEEVVNKADRLRPHVVLLDAVLTDGDTLEAIRHIRTSHKRIGILVLNVSGRLQSTEQVLDAGASAYISPETHIEQLMDLIHATSADMRDLRKPRRPLVGSSEARNESISSTANLPKHSHETTLHTREGRNG